MEVTAQASLEVLFHELAWKSLSLPWKLHTFVKSCTTTVGDRLNSCACNRSRCLPRLSVCSVHYFVQSDCYCYAFLERPPSTVWCNAHFLMRFENFKASGSLFCQFGPFSTYCRRNHFIRTFDFGQSRSCCISSTSCADPLFPRMRPV